MPGPSSIDKLPQELRDRIATLRREGFSIDDIMDRLKGLEHISRSALARHTQKLDAVIERLERARMMAEAIAEKAHQTDMATGRVNMQIMQGLVFDLLTADEAGEGKSLDAKEVATLSRAVADLSRASRQHVEAAEAFRREQALKLSAAEKSGDLSKEASKKARLVLGLEEK